MIHYLDTSALAKRYVAERGSTAVRALFRRGSVAVSRIAYAELLAAIARAERDKVLTAAQRSGIFDRVQRDFEQLLIVEVRPAMLASVPGLVLQHPLRGYDAVQLASALVLRRDGTGVTFWSADEKLVAAAKAEGLRASVPTD